MERRARRDGQLRSRATRSDEHARAEREALLALAPARREAGVALHRLEVLVAARDGLFDVVRADVLAAADDDLVAHDAASSIARAARRACASAASSVRTPVHSPAARTSAAPVAPASSARTKNDAPSKWTLAPACS